MSEKIRQLGLDWFPAVFMTVTLGMIVIGPILAWWTDDANWLWLCIVVVFYLS